MLMSFCMFFIHSNPRIGALVMNQDTAVTEAGVFSTFAELAVSRAVLNVLLNRLPQNHRSGYENVASRPPRQTD